MKTAELKTIGYYNKFAQDYYESTKNIDLQNVYNIVNKYFDKNTLLLDLGCGPCRDSLYFKNKGFNVISLDLSFNLLKIGKINNLNNIVNGNIINLPFKKCVFGFVFANASLLHIPKQYISNVFKQLYDILNKKSFLFATFKIGSGESYDNRNRFFSYYTENEVIELVKTTKFKIIDIETVKSYDKRPIQWLSIIIKPKK